MKIYSVVIELLKLMDKTEHFCSYSLQLSVPHSI